MSGLLSAWLRRWFDAPAVPGEPASRDLHAAPKQRETRYADHREIRLEWVGADDELISAQASVQDRSEHGFGVRLSRFLAVGRTVWVNEPDGPPVKTMVRHCRREGDEHVAGLWRVDHERRRTDRRPVRFEAKLSWEVSAACEFCDVIVLDDSPDGVQVETPQPVPAETVARLSYGGWSRFGITSYCVHKHSKFLVGIHFTGPAHRAGGLEYRD